MKTLKIFAAVAAAIMLVTSNVSAESISNSISSSEIKSADKSKSTTVKNKGKQKKSVKDYAAQAKGNYTGLVVDCRGLKLKTIMSPVIINSNGTPIYGHKNIDPEKIITTGIVAYVKQLSEVARAGSNPLIVKAIGLEYDNSTPVLSLTDSNRVLIENHATKFLKDLKVVFLFD